MRHIIKLLALALLALAALPIRGAAAPTPTPSVGVTQATLPNGFQVVVLRNTLAPAVSMWTNYLAGANDEAIVGTAHAQEHMMFRGSRTIDASQFSQSMAVTGGTFNANTQSEITQYFFEVLPTVSRHRAQPRAFARRGDPRYAKPLESGSAARSRKR